jgi:hypothetical protein
LHIKSGPAFNNERIESAQHRGLVVLGYDGKFYDVVPDDVRKQGPWQGQHLGDVDKLKPEYRQALARDGYALLKCEGAVFKPEA